MSCYMCASTVDVREAPFLAKNISTATALLKREVTPDDLVDALACSNCERAFTEYLNLQERLASIENAFSNKRLPPEPPPPIILPVRQLDPTPDLVFGDLNDHEHEITTTDLYPDIENSSVPYGDEVLIEDQVEMTAEELGNVINFPSDTIDGDLEISAKNFRKIDGIFKCNFCDFTTEDTMIPDMAIHLNSAHYIAVLICEICGDEFSELEELNSHKNESHRKFPCPLCHASFDNQRLLDVHQRMDHSDCPSVLTTRTFSCPHCPKKFSAQEQLDLHVDKHNGIFPHSCTICEAKFTLPHKLKSHMETHKERTRAFPCEQCGKSFFTNASLKKHLLTHTETEMNFECRFCEKKFKFPRNLQQHELTHSSQKAFVCGTCDKSFHRRIDLNDHERIHTGDKPFVCPECGKGFSQKSNLGTHIRTMHLKQEPHKCDQCERTFKRRRLLDCHVLSVHKKDRPFKCHLCPSAYSYPEHLKKHLVNVHEEPSEYPCEFCDKKFTTKDLRKQHRYVHTSHKMYQCVVCEKGFMKRPFLIAHIREMGHLADTYRHNNVVAEEVPGSEKEWQLVVTNKLVELNVNVEQVTEEELVDEVSEEIQLNPDEWDKEGSSMLGYEAFLEDIIEVE